MVITCFLCELSLSLMRLLDLQAEGRKTNQEFHQIGFKTKETRGERERERQTQTHRSNIHHHHCKFNNILKHHDLSKTFSCFLLNAIAIIIQYYYHRKMRGRGMVFTSTSLPAFPSAEKGGRQCHGRLGKEQETDIGSE